MGIAASAPLMAGSMAFFAASMRARDTLQAAPMDSIQAAVPS